MKKFIFTFFLFFSSSVFGSIDIPYQWNYVFIEADRGASVKLVRNKETSKIDIFEIQFDGKKSKLEEKWFADLDSPQFRTVKITSGCNLHQGKEGNLVSDCSSHISFDFWIDVEGERLPEWYEEPQVIFYIKDGVIDKRLVKVKDSENHWSLQWLDSNGNMTGSEIKSFKQ